MDAETVRAELQVVERELEEATELADVLLSVARAQAQCDISPIWSIMAAADDQAIRLHHKKNLLEEGLRQADKQESSGGRWKAWWFSEALANTKIATTPAEQLRFYIAAVAGAWTGIHYWRKGSAILEAAAYQTLDPLRALETRAMWDLSKYHVQASAVWAARFRRRSVAAALGIPLFCAFWLDAKRYDRPRQ